MSERVGEKGGTLTAICRKCPGTEVCWIEMCLKEILHVLHTKMANWNSSMSITDQISDGQQGFHISKSMEDFTV